ncbi:MAG: hypothetical protein SGARI_004197 [Bacillariaceae sp.]
MELGVWRGGAMTMAAALSQEYKRMGGTFLYIAEQNVIENFALFNLYDTTVRFVKGLFKDTVPKIAQDTSIQQIAVLRVDGNFYDSYQDATTRMVKFLLVALLYLTTS